MIVDSVCSQAFQHQQVRGRWKVSEAEQINQYFAHKPQNHYLLHLMDSDTDSIFSDVSHSRFEGEAMDIPPSSLLPAQTLPTGNLLTQP